MADVEVGVGPWVGALPDDPRLDPGAARGRGPAQRRRRVSLLADGRDRGGPRCPPTPVPRRDRELRARLQHRVRRPDRQRLSRRRGAHRRSGPVEPPGSDGHRPLSARTSPPGRRGLRRVGRVPPDCPCWASTTCPEPYPSRRTTCRAPASCCSVRRAPGCPTAARSACDAVLSIAQYGSTRSINAGAAAAIAMHAWVRRHEFGQISDRGRLRRRLKAADMGAVRVVVDDVDDAIAGFAASRVRRRAAMGSAVRDPERAWSRSVGLRPREPRRRGPARSCRPTCGRRGGSTGARGGRRRVSGGGAGRGRLVSGLGASRGSRRGPAADASAGPLVVEVFAAGAVRSP